MNIDLDLYRKLNLEETIEAWYQLTNNMKNDEAIRWLCLNDLFFLLVKGCDMHHALHPWVFARAREVEVARDGYLDLWAREHYKSTLITFGMTIQDILRNPNITIGFISEKWTIASRALDQIRREFTSNQLLKRVFSDILYKNPDKEAPKWTASEIIVKRAGNPKEATITAQGLDSVEVGAHFDLMVYDDVITQRSVTSAERVEKIISNFEISLSMSKQGGRKRYIGTRYAFHDPYQYIIDRQIATERRYPAIDANGIPVLFTQEYWDAKTRENDTYNLACQYLLNPQAGAKPEFDLSTLSWYDVRPFFLEVYLICDPGVRKTSGSCDTAMVVIGVTKGKHLYVLDGMCHPMALSDRWENFRKLYERWSKTPGVSKVHAAYETYGAGKSDLEFFQSEMNKGIAPGRFEIRELENTLKGHESKHSRIRRMDPDLKGHRIFLPWDVSADPDHPGQPTKRQLQAIASNHPNLVAKPIKILHGNQFYNLTDIFLEQLGKFPYGGKVDLIDAFSRIYDFGEIRAPSSLRDKWGSSTFTVKRKPFQFKRLNKASVSR